MPAQSALVLQMYPLLLMHMQSPVPALLRFHSYPRVRNRCKLLKGKSGRRGSNPRRPAWEAGILPLNYSRTIIQLSLA
jgi:hypothetical protein